jgi:hypothetical protein
VAVFIWVTGALTILSAAVYFWVWLKHMASYEPQSAPSKSYRGPIKTDAVRGSGPRDPRSAHYRDENSST